MNTGNVYLVGAGPGDSDLITLRGLRLLQSVDVVIYDRLIPGSLLDEARPGAELIYAGKQPRRHRLSQELINELLVDRALRGLDVLRLKGGDPLIFGRGGEEALACRAYGIPFEIVPGVSSAHAAPAYAGIPLTHRQVSSAFTVITGHEEPGKPASQINYRALARLGGTIVILMGVRQMPAITRRLISSGLDHETRAAVIEWGTLPHQRVITGALGTIAQIAAREGIEPPAITVIGEVVRLRDEGLAWFDDLPISEIEAQIGAIAW